MKDHRRLSSLSGRYIPTSANLLQFLTGLPAKYFIQLRIIACKIGEDMQQFYALNFEVEICR